MDLKTRYNLWKLKRAANPSVAFKATLRKNLNIAWNAKYGGKMPWYQTGMARVATSFAMVTLLLSGGGGVYAYTSPEVTEGSALYSVKQVIETVEEITKITPEAKAKFYIKKISRREAEREVLEKKIQPPEIKPEEVKENKDEIKEEKKEVRQTVKEEIKEVKLEVKVKTKIEVEERPDSDLGRNTRIRDFSVEESRDKIKRTEKSIENIEEQLEKTRQIIEKTESKNIKLREELKNRAEKRLEKAKKQLEIKVEKQENAQEKLRVIRLRNGVKTEVRNASSLNR